MQTSQLQPMPRATTLLQPKLIFLFVMLRNNFPAHDWNIGGARLDQEAAPVHEEREDDASDHVAAPCNSNDSEYVHEIRLALEPCRRGGKSCTREEQAASHSDDDEVDREQNRDYEATKGWIIDCELVCAACNGDGQKATHADIAASQLRSPETKTQG